MCLSTVYKNNRSDENILCSNIMLIDVNGSQITLINLFGERTIVEGSLKRANLTDGYVIIDVA